MPKFTESELQLFVNRNTIRHVQWTSYHHFQAALGEAQPTDAQYISSGPLPPLATVRVCAYVCACAHLCFFCLIVFDLCKQWHTEPSWTIVGFACLSFAEAGL